MIDILQNKQTAAAYLGAMIDGEGNVEYVPAPKSIRTVKISNTRVELLDLCEKAYNLLGINCWRKVSQSSRQIEANPDRKLCYNLCVSNRRNLEILYREVPIHHPEKKKLLKEAIESYKYKNYEIQEKLQCLKCKKFKQRDNFYLLKNTGRGREYYCKNCKHDIYLINKERNEYKNTGN